MSLGKNAVCNSGVFRIRHTVLNTMHTLIFFIKDRNTGEMTFWLDALGGKVTAVSIPYGVESLQKMPAQAVNYLASIRRITRKHQEASFMKGPGAKKVPPQARRH